MAADFLRLEMLPARHGDALLLEWGDERRTRRLLVDGGPIGAFIGGKVVLRAIWKRNLRGLKQLVE